MKEPVTDEERKAHFRAFLDSEEGDAVFENLRKEAREREASRGACVLEDYLAQRYFFLGF